MFYIYKEKNLNKKHILMIFNRTILALNHDFSSHSIFTFCLYTLSNPNYEHEWIDEIFVGFRYFFDYSYTCAWKDAHDKVAHDVQVVQKVLGT